MPQLCCGTTRVAESTGTGRAPDQLSHGNTFIRERELEYTGFGWRIDVSQDVEQQGRWPLSQTASQVGMFGPNWRSTYEERVFLGSDNYIKYARSDGSFLSLAYLVANVGSQPMPLAAGNTNSATLQVTNMSQGATNWTINFQNGEQRIFSKTSGSLYLDH